MSKLVSKVFRIYWFVSFSMSHCIAVNKIILDITKKLLNDILGPSMDVGFFCIVNNPLPHVDSKFDTF